MLRIAKQDADVYGQCAAGCAFGAAPLAERVQPADTSPPRALHAGLIAAAAEEMSAARESEVTVLTDADDTRMLLNSIKLEEGELHAVGEEEPKFLLLEICLDSGAGDHVLAQVDIP